MGQRAWESGYLVCLGALTCGAVLPLLSPCRPWLTGSNSTRTARQCTMRLGFGEMVRGRRATPRTRTVPTSLLAAPFLPILGMMSVSVAQETPPKTQGMETQTKR